MELYSRILADIILVVHIAYVAYAVFGQLLILIGWPLGWRWIRNPWFRITHLVMILIVTTEATLSVISPDDPVLCPLTTWERALRGEIDDGGSAMGQWTHDILTIPEWVFNPLCIAFGVLVLATLVFVPPRFRRSASAPTPPVNAVATPGEMAP